MQRVSVITFLHQFIGNFLCLFAGTAEDDTVNLRIIVYDAFQGGVFIFCMYGIDHMLHVARTFVLASDGDLFCIVKVVLRNTGYFRAHSGREKQCVTFLWNICQDGIDTVRKAHIEHFVRFVHHYVCDSGKRYRFAFHQVEESPRCGNNDMHTPFQAAYLAVDG